MSSTIIEDHMDDDSGLGKSLRVSFGATWREAAKHNIEWRLTRAEFARVWGIRWVGRHRCGLTLARIDTTRPYEMGNVHIVSRVTIL